MVPGNLVRIRKSVIDGCCTLWFIDLAERKAPMLLLGKVTSQLWRVLRPDGTICFIAERKLTKRMW
jgi:hypothetical protein